MKEVEELVENKDLYHVVVKPGMDQAFVFGVIAILDHIYGESTHCWIQNSSHNQIVIEEFLRKESSNSLRLICLVYCGEMWLLRQFSSY